MLQGTKLCGILNSDGSPFEEFFMLTLTLNLKGLVGELFKDTYTADIKAGTLTTEWAKRLGLDESVAVG